MTQGKFRAQNQVSSPKIEWVSECQWINGAFLIHIVLKKSGMNHFCSSKMAKLFNLYSNGHKSLNFWTWDLILGSKFSLGHCLDGWTMTKWIRVDQKFSRVFKKNSVQIFTNFGNTFLNTLKNFFRPPYSIVSWLSLLGNDLRKI